MKNFSKHLPHYLSLFAVIGFGILGFYLYSWDRAFQLSILTGVAVAYVAWGMIHHYIHKDLSTAVILEYVAVAILGLTIVFSLIIRT